MLVASTRLGDLDIDENTVLEFADGLLGFGSARRFALVDTHDTGTYYWLQSLDDSGLAFLTVRPWAFFPDYEPELPEADRVALGLEDAADALVLCLLTVDRATSSITANLLGPLVVNAAAKVGRQVVLTDSGLSTRAPLAVP
ncbi:MAG: flagellar assembly protein FliW [Acidimicrobiia bacterium]|nr:flagellar assembly protein FliW [Acidimicrobiia bacterium]